MFDRADSTMILQTGQEINELESSGFHTEGPTVFCGNISADGNGIGNNYIVQVANGSILAKVLIPHFVEKFFQEEF